MKSTLTLSEVANNRFNDNELLEDIIIDDEELLEAIRNYQKGKILENEANRLINESKKIFDEKLYARKVKSACDKEFRINCIEYDVTRFDTTRFKNENPNMYDMFTVKNTSHKYKIDAIADIDITIK